jgi:hypothetical protein
MFEKITAARNKLKALHQGDPGHAAEQELYGAFEGIISEIFLAGNDLSKRLVDLNERVLKLEESSARKKRTD